MAAASPPPFRRWPWWRRWLGQRAERAAARFLRRQGHRLLASNLRDPLGEIDLLTLDGDCLVVVEVRSTGAEDADRPAESVDVGKQRRLTEAALRFLHRHRLLDATVRFDVLAIAWPPDRREPHIVHYPHAFEAVGRFQMYH